MTLFREHRGQLDDSMATVVEVEDRAALEMHLAELFRPWVGVRDAIDWTALRIEPYGRDDRIGWDTQLVTLPGHGVLGMTDGPLAGTPADPNDLPTTGVMPANPTEGTTP